MSAIGEFFWEHLPALQVILPMIIAPVCVLTRRRQVAWALAVATTWMTLGISWTLLQTVRAEGFVTYAMGGLGGPVGDRASD